MDSQKPYESQRPQGKLRRKNQPRTTPTLSPQQAKIQRILAAGDSIPSSSWPLPASPAEKNGPLTTSSGVVNSEVPQSDVGKRKSADNVLDIGSESTAVAAPGAVDADELERLKMTKEKKKRFGNLRKVFGMKT